MRLAIVTVVLLLTALFHLPAPHRMEEGGPLVEEHGRMTVPRAAHQATPLADGRVLVTGGCGDAGCETMRASAELYDPADETFRVVAPMPLARGSHEAVDLPDGRVLVTGGWTPEGPTDAAVIYDPTTDRWTPLPRMRAPRVSHNAVTLADGRILLVGGDGPPATAEIFDPATLRFGAAAPAVADAGTYLPISLADGRVLVTGGPTAAAQVYDMTTGAFESTGRMTAPRTKHAAALLPDGRVLLAGGSDGGGYRDRMASTEFYDPTDGTFSPGPTMTGSRFKIRDAVVVLPGGEVLVAGGAPFAEILDPGSGTFARVRGDLDAPRMFATATLLPSGAVLLLGGYDTDIRPTASAWLFRPGDPEEPR